MALRLQLGVSEFRELREQDQLAECDYGAALRAPGAALVLAVVFDGKCVAIRARE